MSTTDPVPEAGRGTAGLAVRNLDVTRPHSIHLHIETGDGGRTVHADTYLLDDGEECVSEDALLATVYEVEVSLDGSRTTTVTCELADGDQLLVAVGNGFVHVGDRL